MRKIILFVALAATISASSQNMHEVSKQLNVFNQLYKTLDQYYVDTLDAEKNISTAISAMLERLDPYTEYYSPSDAKDLNTMTTGKYAGVGALIHYYKAQDRCIFYQLYQDKPAAKSGIKAGDIILTIDGKEQGPKGNQSLNEYISSVSSALRGDPATVAKVKVKRPGVEEPLEFEITRASVQLPSVPYSSMVSDQVGYIYLSTFTSNCSQDVLTALRQLKSQGAKSLVLDLRGNGGGLANEAVKIINLFVEKGKLILKMKGKYADANTSYATQSVAEDTQIPLVVLVNGGSASASEIVCGSLQDLDRAVILGQRTYGKGLVQQPHELPNNGILKLTTSHYYIPSGRCIQALDYSHRDTELYRTPDSLRKTFLTEAGRQVLDGGGISPDIEVKSDTMPALLSYLVNSDEYFDYITTYCQKHEQIAPAREFTITAEDFEAFVGYIVSTNFSPQYRSTNSIKQLREQLKAEDASQQTLEKLEELEASLKPNLAEILPQHKEQLIERINADIAERYYYTKGAMENQIKSDKQLIAALELLADKERYASILKK